MKTLKKVIPFLLAAVFVLGIAVTASAKTFPDVTSQNPYTGAIDTLSDIRVIEGYTDGTFAPDTPVTRWQMALLISKLVTGKIEADKYWKSDENKTTFEDVEPYQYLGSINYANENNIVKGRSEKVFDPNAGINLQEGITMAIRALGYPSEELDKNWPTSYMSKANTIGLLKEIDSVKWTDTLTRGDTAQLLENTLYAVKYSSDGVPSNIATDIFGLFSSKQYVLVAVGSDSIVGGSSARNDSAVFFELKENGTYGEALTVKISDLPGNYTDSTLYSLIGNSFKFSYKNDELSNVKQASKSSNLSKSKLTVLYETDIRGNKTPYGFSIANSTTTYAPVSAFSGKATGSNREIIVYSTNGAIFSNLADIGTKAVTIKNIEGTTDKFEMTAFDDDGDGFYDRAIYNPFEAVKIGYNTVTGAAAAQQNGIVTVTSLGGTTLNTIPENKLTLSGFTSSKITDGSYAFYSYYPVSGTAKLEFLANKLDKAKIISYTYGNTTIALDTSTTTFTVAKTYKFGANIIGADTATVLKGVKQYQSYVDVPVQYLDFGDSLLVIDFDNAEAYVPTVYTGDLRIVKSIDTTNIGGNPASVLVTFTDDIQTEVRYLNGRIVRVQDYKLLIGDIVEWTTIGTGANQYNNLNRATPNPSYLNEGTAKDLVYYKPTTGTVEYLELRTSDTIITRIPVKSGATKIVNGNDEFVLNAQNFAGLNIAVGQAVYYTTFSSPTNDKYATTIFIKAYVTDGNAVDVNDFDTICFIPDVTTAMAHTIVNNVHSYNNTFDILAGEVNNHYTSDEALTNRGYFKVKAGKIVGNSPILDDVSNTSGLSFDQDRKALSAAPVQNSNGNYVLTLDNNEVIIINTNNSKLLLLQNGQISNATLVNFVSAVQTTQNARIDILKQIVGANVIYTFVLHV